MTVTSAELNPGAYTDFKAEHSITDQAEAIERHSAALSAHRLAIAAELGLTLDDLHDRRQAPVQDVEVA